MRKLLPTLVVLGALAAPAAAPAAPFTASIADAGQPFARASAVCGCVVQFTGWYTHNSYNTRARVQTGLARRGIGWPKRKRFNQGVYDYAKGGYGSTPGWCKRNPKTCRAVIACMTGAGLYLLSAPHVLSPGELARRAAAACVLTASAALAP